MSTLIIAFEFIYSVCLCVCVWLGVCVCKCSCHSTNMKVIVQLEGVHSLLLPCGLWGIIQVVRLGGRCLYHWAILQNLPSYVRPPSLSSDTAGYCVQVKPACSPLRANASPRTKAQKQLLRLAPSSASSPHGRDAVLLYKGQQCLQRCIQNRDLVGLPWALQGWVREKQEAHRVVCWQKSWVLA